jgi:class 3 adenylate cyclase
LIALLADFVVLIIVYQGIVNRFPRVVLAIPLFIGMVAAMTTDAIVFRAIKDFSLSSSIFFVGAKAQAGAAVAIPLAAYCSWRIRASPESVKQGLLNRGALDIVDLRARVQEIEEDLKQARAEYVMIKDTFGRYVSPDVVDAIVADPTKLELGGELRDVTILFADIRGYSTLSEVLGPTEIIDLLNVYFRRVSAVIFRHEGMINEFEGDAVLAVFGAPLDMEDHAARAVRTALDMLEAVDELNVVWAEDGTLAKWQAVGIERLSIRIGVHSGPVVAGNIGSEQRIKYAVIGDTVNTASRVEGLNKVLKTSLLITAATLQKLSGDPIVGAVTARGSHAVKGRREPVTVYTVDRDAAAAFPPSYM